MTVSRIALVLIAFAIAATILTVFRDLGMPDVALLILGNILAYLGGVMTCLVLLEPKPDMGENDEANG